MKALSLAVFAILALGGCHQQASEPMAKSGPALVIKAGRLVLPAVKTNPGAAYFTLINQGASDITITEVAIADTMGAMMHETSGTTMKPLETATVPKGGSLIFAPSGKHVMVMGIDPGLTPGGTAHATLTTKEIGKVEAELKVTAAADAAGDDMSGMKM